jgi:hypothetical protein
VGIGERPSTRSRIQSVQQKTSEKSTSAVMHFLAEAGIKAGVDLRFDGGEVRFDHRWVLLTAEKVV